ncbi:DUF4350 domain-containing protein [Streptomyces sp. NBC_00101]|uniref:DUF4350 domain-containing protein n=1 Tax=Streptomyces sp. NBC_00101 TaxID=2975651 RepID=UPI00324CEE27
MTSSPATATTTGSGSAATGSTSLSATPAQLWKRTRGFVIALLVLLVGGLATVALHSGSRHGALDPGSADPDGSRALAELLTERGVTVEAVTTLDGALSAYGPDSTLLVTDPDLLTRSQQVRLADATAHAGGRTVLIAAGPPSLPALAPGVRAADAAGVTARTPQCAYPAARRAGGADMGGITYESEAAGTFRCYPARSSPALLVVPRPGGETVLLGSPDILVNRRLAHEGNASLALQLLGSRTHLVWYLPSLSDPSSTGDDRDGTGGGDADPSPGTGSGAGGSDRDPGAGEGPGQDDEVGFFDLIPSGWLWGTLQLAVAAGLAAVWRGRRFGPLVTENLPVAVHASEATEGHARLYRKADARDRAADLLREAARTRLAPLVGVSPRDAHSPDVLVPALSPRLPADGDPAALLFGRPPADDTALVRLADQLDALEREVRTS